MTRSAPKSTARPRRTLRLPTSVRPIEVDLHLRAAPKRRAFEVEVTYRLRVERRTREIELHATGLEIDRVQASVAGTSDPLSPSLELHPECETAVFRFERPLEAGELHLSMRARGRVRDDLRGLYRSSDRQTPWIATQLCPTDARRVFPCFDEPGTKARYAIRVTAPAGETVVSNAPVARRSRATRGQRTTLFETTPPLSVYLIAIAIGPFERSRPVHVGATPIRIVTLPGARRLGRFALEAAAESLARLERWFGMPHPYAKLDLVALPDFAFGAMENAGAVFFRDAILLLDDRTASADDRLRTAETVAHELAHMWFGNLVTMAWWNDLWLNESFATWMAYEIVHDWQPDWKVWHAFIARRESALELDALRTSHPIAPPVETADEAQENFDAITYTKGAAVLRMLQRYAGATRFRAGVRRYIRRHREGVATASDLWSALEAAADLPVESIVRPWTRITGHPVVDLVPARGGRLRARQTRFLLGGARGRSATWEIPWIGRPTQGRRQRAHRRVLARTESLLPADVRADAAIYGNADEAGFFRVDHGDEGFEALRRNLPRLSSLERIGWIGHEWALVRAGRAPIGRLVRLLDALGGERDPDVLFAAERVHAALARRLAPDAGEDVARALAARVVSIHRDALEALGLDARRAEDAERTRRRARLLSLVGGLGADAAWRARCAERVARFLDDGRALPRGAADVVLRVGGAAAPSAVQRKLIAAVRSAATPQARRERLFALAAFTRPRDLARTLKAAGNPRLAPAGDRATLLMQLVSSRATAETTWDHLRTEWPRLEGEMPPILVARLAGELANALPGPRLDEIPDFFARHPLAAGERTVRQLEEQIRLARALSHRAGGPLRAALSSPVA